MEDLRAPNEEDKEIIAELAQQYLGEGATARFFDGVRAKGVRGDQPHYGYVVLATIPNAWSEGKIELPYAKLAEFSTAVTNAVDISGNVIIDVTPPEI